MTVGRLVSQSLLRPSFSLGLELGARVGLVERLWAILSVRGK